MERHDLGQNLDPEKLAATVRDVIANSPKQVEEVKSGKLGILKWFVGAVMKATDGKANPQEAEEMVKKELGV
jgi:aspartyl-tRNA(Asn)/glutamyl-tRNA(Gln) amidotransferase subunit B